MLPSTNSLVEVWLPIPGYAGYEVSSFGSVRSFRSYNGRGPFVESARQILSKPAKGKKYLRVGLATECGKTVSINVHILVLLAFVGPRPKGYDACHNDGYAQNNNVRNLRWDTKQSNADDKIKHNTQVRGVQVSLSKLNEHQVAEIKAAIPFWKKGMGKHFAQKFGVGATAISYIKHGKTWLHV